MNYLFNPFVDETNNSLSDLFFLDHSYSTNMKTDIIETEKEYQFDIEIPGYSKDQISLSFEKGYLTIQAKKNNPGETKNIHYLRRERKTNQLERSFYLGEDVEKDKISATFKDGILTVLVPKVDEKILNQKRSISIN